MKEQAEPKQEIKVNLELRGELVWQEELMQYINKLNILIYKQFLIIQTVNGVLNTKIKAEDKQILLSNFTNQLQDLVKVQQELSGELADFLKDL